MKITPTGKVLPTFSWSFPPAKISTFTVHSLIYIMLKLTYIAVLQDLNTSPYWFCNINKLDKDLNVNSPEVSQFPELSSHLINVIYRGFHTVGFQLLSLQWTVLFSRLSGALEINVLTNYITGSAWYSTKFDMNSGLPQGYVSVYIADCPRGKVPV